MKQKDNRLRFLSEIGLDVLDDNNKEWTCVCPWCFDDRGHLYLNSEDILCDCKICCAHGNYFALLEQLALNLAGELTEKELRKLARDRQLPTTAFKGLDIGFTGKWYTLPVQNRDGHIRNVLRYRLGGKLLSAPGSQVGLGSPHP